MKLTLEPSQTVDTINGTTQARIWTGVTDQGVRVKAWIAVVQPQTHDEGQLKAFDAALQEVKADRRPTSFDLRIII